MTTRNLFEQTAPSENADGGTAKGEGVEVEATWNNEGADPDPETGVDEQSRSGSGGRPGPDNAGAVAANPCRWIWSRKSKYVGTAAAAVLVAVAAGTGIGVWESENRKINANQATAVIKTSKSPKVSREPKASKAPKALPSLAPTTYFPAVDYCYYVNGLCWLWASPCSGYCSQLNPLSSYNSFCPAGLRYATQAEFDAAVPTLIANKEAFFAKCAAGPLDPTHNHCDSLDPFARVEDNGYNELVLVCGGGGSDIDEAITVKPNANAIVASMAAPPTPSKEEAATTTTKYTDDNTLALELKENDQQKQKDDEDGAGNGGKKYDQDEGKCIDGGCCPSDNFVETTKSKGEVPKEWENIHVNVV